jgi:hypothetical protein
MTDDRTEIDHYQNDGDADGEWGEPVRPSTKRRLDAVVSVRFDPSELELIRKVAPDGNLSTFIRNSALAATSREINGWSFTFSVNGTRPRDNGLTASSQDLASQSETTMVLATWEQPTVQLAEAS